MIKNILISYPRSGNHLCRFFIELLTQTPSFGNIGNPKYNIEPNLNDIEIYKNDFSNHIPFNINKDYNKEDCFYKFHNPPPNEIIPEKCILLLRNPQEVLLRQNKNKINFNKTHWSNYYIYDDLISYYLNLQCKKIIFFYEDIILDRIQFIEQLYSFLECKNSNKLIFCKNNIDYLYELSITASNRVWWGNLSNYNIDFYYQNIPYEIKDEFDTFISYLVNKYDFLKIKYNL
jgi:hypothetical protein